MEKTNFRYMQPQDIDDVLDFASVDVSFISLTKILLPARRLLTDNGQMVCLIKPQFEAGREKVGKKGVVRDKKVHEEVIRKILLFAGISGFSVLDLSFSPIKGPEGNIEYLVHLQKDITRNEAVLELSEKDAEGILKEQMENGDEASPQWEQRLHAMVEQAHEKLEEEA